MDDRPKFLSDDGLQSEAKRLWQDLEEGEIPQDTFGALLAIHARTRRQTETKADTEPQHLNGPETEGVRSGVKKRRVSMEDLEIESGRAPKKGRSTRVPDRPLVPETAQQRSSPRSRVHGRAARGASPTRTDKNTILSHATVPDLQNFGDLSSDFEFEFPSAFDNFTSSVEDLCCDGECTAKTCPSCRSCELSCFLPCENPEECESGICEDLSCAGGSPLPSCTGHHKPLSYTPTFDQCGWVGNGENCTATVSSPGQTVQHVTESHIKPQTQVTCHWNDCGFSTDVHRLPNHLWTDHEPASYVCLWFNCEQAFSTHEELDEHFKMVHCHMGCHWAGCEKTTTSETELQDHFSSEHIHPSQGPLSQEHVHVDQGPPAQTQQWHDRGRYGSATASSASSHQHHPSSNDSASSMSIPLSLQGPHSTNTSSANPILHPEEAYKYELPVKTCMWIVDPGRGTNCGMICKDGNSLQDHIRRAHILCLPSTELRCAWKGCSYVQATKDKSKLARHVYTHSKYCFGACKFCGQEFSEKSKLQQHEATHKNERPYACKKCDSRFPTQNALTNHGRIHKNEKPLKCDFQLPSGEKCNYTCSDPSNMSTHRKKHLPPKFACNICDKAFCRRDTLKRHMLVHDPFKLAAKKRGYAEMTAVASDYFQGL